MKTYLFLLVFIVLSSCSSNDDIQMTNFPTPATATFAIYDNVTAALSNHTAFSSEMGTLLKRYEDGEVIHVQVSPSIQNQSSVEIEKLVMQSLVEAAFKAFAHTTVEDIQLTTIPLDKTSVPPAFNYLEAYSVTANINRKTIFKVAEKHVLVRDLKQLYNFDETNGVWYTNDRFDMLRTLFLEDAFAELVK